MLSIVLPTDLFKDNNANIIKDEHGRVFDICGPELIHFDNKIPNWYMNYWSFIIKDIDIEGVIGNYVRICDLSE